MEPDSQEALKQYNRAISEHVLKKLPVDSNPALKALAKDLRHFILRLCNYDVIVSEPAIHEIEVPDGTTVAVTVLDLAFDDETTDFYGTYTSLKPEVLKLIADEDYSLRDVYKDPDGMPYIVLHRVTRIEP